MVRASDGQRDHASRNSYPALLYFVFEGFLRELGGPGRVLGNHVIIEHEGSYAVLAHLRRGSNQVTPGQHVTAGSRIAECGNSGNSTEPHVHFHLMDRPRPFFAAGLPMSFDRFEVDGEHRSGVPSGDRPFTVPTDAVDREPRASRTTRSDGGDRGKQSSG